MTVVQLCCPQLSSVVLCCPLLSSVVFLLSSVVWVKRPSEPVLLHESHKKVHSADKLAFKLATSGAPIFWGKTCLDSSSVVLSSVVLCCPLLSTKSFIPQINRLLKWPLLEPRYFGGKPVLSSVVLCCPLLSFVVLGGRPVLAVVLIVELV